MKPLHATGIVFLFIHFIFLRRKRRGEGINRVKSTLIVYINKENPENLWISLSFNCIHYCCLLQAYIIKILYSTLAVFNINFFLAGLYLVLGLSQPTFRQWAKRSKFRQHIFLNEHKYIETQKRLPCVLSAYLFLFLLVCPNISLFCRRKLKTALCFRLRMHILLKL